METARTIPEIQKQAIDVILERGVEFTVTVAHPNILHRLGIIPTEKHFTIRPLYLGALLRISRLVLEIDANVLKTAGGNLHDIGVESIAKYKDTMVRIAALAIMNSDREPGRRLLRYLDRNLNVRDLLRILNLVVRQMDVKDFLACMVSMRSLNLLETGKAIQDTTTSGGQQEASSSISDSIGEVFSGK